MEIELASVSLRAAVLVAGMHAKILDKTPTMGLWLNTASGLVRLETPTGDYYIAAAYVESAEALPKLGTQLLNEHAEPLPPHDAGEAENRQIFERVKRDEAEKLDVDVDSLLEEALPKSRRRAKK